VTSPDLNLLVTLDVLLSEGSVAGAARRLRLSPSAMSRALARLRDTTGDPLLVRAGRGLVPTPRAIALRERIGPFVEEAQRMLGPTERLDLSRLVRTFTFRTREGFVENFGPALIARVEAEAPRVRLAFLAKGDRDSAPLRDGRVDLETGVVGAMTGPELRASALFRDRFVGVVRPGHPLVGAAVTPAAYAGGRHVLAGASGSDRGPIDEALQAVGLQREVATIVGGFAAALALCRACDLVATVPERHTGNLRDGLVTFPLPFDAPEIPISLLWHPRLDGDPAHRWLRGCVKEICAP
jgi:DNA-binding transcriptional LysR family regulator